MQVTTNRCRVEAEENLPGGSGPNDAAAAGVAVRFTFWGSTRRWIPLERASFTSTNGVRGVKETWIWINRCETPGGQTTNLFRLHRLNLFQGRLNQLKPTPGTGAFRPLQGLIDLLLLLLSNGPCLHAFQNASKKRREQGACCGLPGVRAHGHPSKALRKPGHPALPVAAEPLAGHILQRLDTGRLLLGSPCHVDVPFETFVAETGLGQRDGAT